MPKSRRVTSGRDNEAVQKDVALQVMVPPRVKRELKVRAAREGATQRTIVLEALKGIGLSVSKEELRDHRKARQRLKSGMSKTSRKRM